MKQPSLSFSSDGGVEAELGPGLWVGWDRVLAGRSLAGSTVWVPLCGGHRAKAATQDTFPVAVSLLCGSGLRGPPHMPLRFTCLRVQNRPADKPPALLLSHVVQEGAQRP